MKKILLILSMVFALGISVMAQDEHRPQKPDAQELTNRMKTQLNLTEEQYNSVYAANEEMIAMVEKAGGREADRETIGKIRKAHVAKLNEILTPEQMEKLKQQKKERGPKKKPIE